MNVVRYSPARHEQWDRFIQGSKNGTFLFLRDYMDYHADRFVDHSLLVYAADQLLAVIPANEDGERFASHAGLTYGGVISDEGMTTTTMMRAFDATLSYLNSAGFRLWHYKTVPHIYHRIPAQEDLYCLFRWGARLVRRDVLSVMSALHRIPLQQRRRRGVSLARKSGLAFSELGDYREFWEVLEDNLQKHRVLPVHSLSEMALLHSRFPTRIRLFGAVQKGALCAGVVVYESENVAHFQYIASNEEGREVGALDGLLDHLVNEIYLRKPYIDFGISNEAQGRVLNAGLIEHKEGFGARAVVHDFYDLEVPIRIEHGQKNSH